MNEDDRKTIRAVLRRMSTIEDIREMQSMASERWSAIQAAACRDFMKGDEVTFVHKGLTIHAIVDRANRKTVSLHEVERAHKKWRVSPNLLTLVEA